MYSVFGGKTIYKEKDLIKQNIVFTIEQHSKEACKTSIDKLFIC